MMLCSGLKRMDPGAGAGVRSIRRGVAQIAPSIQLCSALLGAAPVLLETTSPFL